VAWQIPLWHWLLALHTWPLGFFTHCPERQTWSVTHWLSAVQLARQPVLVALQRNVPQALVVVWHDPVLQLLNVAVLDALPSTHAAAGLQALLQQVLPTQNVLWHWLPPPQVAPLACFGLHSLLPSQ